MGPELLAALAVAGTGTVVSGMADRKADKERRSILNRSMDRSAETQGKATDMVLGEAKKFSADQRMADMQAQEAANFDQAQKDGAIPGLVPSSSEGEGKALSLGEADKALAEGNRMTAIARELAKVRAPNQMAANDSIRRAGLADQTGSMWTDNRAQANGASLDAQNVKAPWWGTLGKMAQAAGMAYAGNVAGAGAGASAAGMASGAAGGAAAGAGYGGINWGGR